MRLVEKNVSIYSDVLFLNMSSLLQLYILTIKFLFFNKETSEEEESDEEEESEEESEEEEEEPIPANQNAQNNNLAAKQPNKTHNISHDSSKETTI